MPWSLLRNTESKFLIYTGTDMLSFGFVYLSARSKQQQQNTICIFPLQQGLQMSLHKFVI